MLSLLYAAVLGVLVHGLGDPDWRTREWYSDCLRLYWTATGSSAVTTASPEVAARASAAAIYADGTRALAVASVRAYALYAAEDIADDALDDDRVRRQFAALAVGWGLAAKAEDVFNTEIYGEGEYAEYVRSSRGWSAETYRRLWRERKAR